MTELTEYFDLAGERQRLMLADNTYLSRTIEGVLVSEDFATVLHNSSLDLGANIGPPKILDEYLSGIFADDETIVATVERWYKNTPVDAAQRKQEATRMILARHVAEGILADARTQWALEQGLTIIPVEVISEAQTGFFHSDLPVSAEGQETVVEGTAMGINAAVGRIAQELSNSSLRELFERTSIMGLVVSLNQEFSELRPPIGDDHPREYIDTIRSSFTGTWVSNLKLLRDGHVFEEATTAHEKEVEALIEVVAKVVYALAFASMRTASEEQIAEHLRHAQEFLMDMINARWQIMALNPAPEDRMDKSHPQDSSVESSEAVLGSIFSTLYLNGIELPEGLTETSVIESLSGKVKVRGNFTPEQLLRNTLIEARKRSKDPAEIRQHLAHLQNLISNYATHDNKTDDPDSVAE